MMQSKTSRLRIVFSPFPSRSVRNPLLLNLRTVRRFKEKMVLNPYSLDPTIDERELR